jgi:hypothetical protein
MTDPISWTWLVCGTPLISAAVYLEGSVLLRRLPPAGSVGCPAWDVIAGAQ